MPTYFYAEECQKSFNHGLHKYELRDVAVWDKEKGDVDFVEKVVCIYCGLQPKPCEHEIDHIVGGIPGINDYEIPYCIHCMGELESKPIVIDDSEPALFQ